MGSDTVEGILSINHYYKHKMAAFSVYATEHSIECQFGLDPEGEKAYLRHQLAKVKELGGTIASLVIDGKDVMRCAAVLCSPEFVDIIKASGIKVVFRPDSGDMMEIVPAIIRMQQEAYGYELTSTGHRLTRYVGVIQGDGVDHQAIRTLLGWLVVHGYAAACVVFGSGGALLQKVNRDKYKFAQKCSAVLLTSGQWFGTAKDPITDPGKKSMEGVITLGRNRKTGELRNLDLTQGLDENDWEDMHKLAYHCGTLYNETTLDEMRERLAA
jgi:nicotinamide phosphoribosyltransferase